jgi:hypothetical protein
LHDRVYTNGRQQMPAKKAPPYLRSLEQATLVVHRIARISVGADVESGPIAPFLRIGFSQRRNILDLRLESESGIVHGLKLVSLQLLVPGTLLGYFVAGGMVHDISFLIANLANLVFYAVLAYFLLAWKSRVAKS